MAVYMSSSNPLAQKEQIAFSDLKEERFVMVSQDMQFRDLTEERCLKAGFRPKIVFVASDIISILDRVKAQNAVFVGMNMIHDVEGLTKVTLDEPDFFWTLCMAYTKNTLLDKRKAKVLRCMSDFFRRMK
jgi:DNA-binding transcriptional LysR family regulator